MDELLKELIEFVQQASPLVWSALLKQVYIYAFQHLVWGVLFGSLALVCSIVCSRFTAKWITLVKEEDYVEDHVSFLSVFSGCLAILSWLITFGMLIEGISRFINPEYYAIRLILYQLK